MKIQRLDDGTVVLSRLDSFCCEMLQQVGRTARIDDAAVHERLFSSPTAGREPRFEEDWRRYVEPELRELFQSAAEIVEGDVKGLAAAGGSGSRRIRIPAEHLEAWIHVLNQARLALAAYHQFGDREMQQVLPAGEGARGLALLQVHVYGLLIECFLGEIE